MSDIALKRVTGVQVKLVGSHSLFSGFCDHTQDLFYEGVSYKTATSLEFDLSAITITLDAGETQIKGIPVGTDELMLKLQAKYPFQEIGIEIYSFELDTSGAIVVSTVWKLFKGKLFSLKRHLLTDHLAIVAKGDKYYMDARAGLTCVESCVVSYFGDHLCQKAVHSELIQIDTITGTSVGFASKPTGVNYLYRKGYLSYLGLDITIEDWDDTPGTSASLVSPAPADWLGKVVTIYAGCDKLYTTCRDIHNNTSNGLFLGINMVDYNTYFETE